MAYGLHMSDLTIREAEEIDTPQILALLQEMADYVKAPHFILNEEAVRRDMFGLACHCDLLFCGGEAAGVATWFWTYKSFRALRGVYVEDLFVRPQYRGRGAGKALLAHLAAKAAGGFLEWQVLNWNSRAIAFYEKLGAKPVTQWLNYRLEGDALERLVS
jgi:GNAT superfamily N-acetyltransferase